MAVSTSSLTLAQYAQQSNEPLIQSIVYSLLETDNILSDMAFVTRPTMKVNGSRVVGGLPTMGW